MKMAEDVTCLVIPIYGLFDVNCLLISCFKLQVVLLNKFSKNNDHSQIYNELMHFEALCSSWFYNLRHKICDFQKGRFFGHTDQLEQSYPGEERVWNVLMSLSFDDDKVTEDMLSKITDNFKSRLDDVCHLVQ